MKEPKWWACWSPGCPPEDWRLARRQKCNKRKVVTRGDHQRRGQACFLVAVHMVVTDQRALVRVRVGGQC